MLASDSDLDVVGTAGDLDELLRLIDEFRPDVVMTDIRMPPEHSDEGLQAAAHCRNRYPEMGVILLSQYVESDYVRILLEHGTERRGYLLKERVADLDDLVLAMREVSKGGSALDPKVVEVLVHNRSAERGTALARLTPRELEVLEAMAQGHTNSAIARDLVLSVRAVEKHINSIFSKLGLSGDESTHPRVRAVLLYLSKETPPA
jgi:DNA-binding NarL/FixJ family response regulator